MIDLSILLPTRHRVSAVREMLRSVLETAVHPERIEVVLTADFDDPATQALDVPGLTITRLVGQQRQLGQAYRRCLNASRGEWVMFAGDACRFESFGWDRLVRQTFSHFPDRVALLWGRDERSTRPTHLFVPRVVDATLEGLGFEGYRRSHVTAHIYDVFRQLNARGHERRRALPDLRITCETREVRPDATALEQQVADERTYIAWSEERRWLAVELERRILAAMESETIRRAA